MNEHNFHDGPRQLFCSNFSNPQKPITTKKSAVWRIFFSFLNSPVVDGLRYEGKGLIVEALPLQYSIALFFCGALSAADVERADIYALASGPKQVVGAIPMPSLVGNDSEVG